MKVNSIRINALLNIINTVLNILFPLITYPYITRILTAVGMGKISFFASISSYAIMLGSLGISTYGIRAVAKVRDNQEDLSKTTTELFALNMIVTIAVIAVLVALASMINKFSAEPALMFFNILVIFFTPFGLSWFFSGLEQYSYITKRNLVFKGITLILVFVLVKNSEDYPVYVALTAFSSIGAVICNFFYSRHFASIRIKPDLDYRQHLKPMLYLFASILAVSVYTNLDTIMLGFINGNREVGIYSVASKIKWLLLSAVNAVSAVLLPRLSNYISNQEIEKYDEALRKSVSFISLVTIPLSVYFFLEAADSIYLLGGKDYKDAILCMQILMPILIISGFSNVTGNQILIPNGHDSYFMRAVAVGALVDIVLNAMLMPSLAATGAAIATLIAEITQMAIQFYYAKDEIFKNFNIKNLSKTLMSGGIAGVSILLVRNMVDINSFLNLVITSVIFFVVYGVFLIVFKEKYIKELLAEVEDKWKH